MLQIEATLLASNTQAANLGCISPGGHVQSLISKKVWAIAEGYIPGQSTGESPELTRHETACILNTTNQTANVQINIYYKDQQPVGPYKVQIPPQRTVHLRFNALNAPEPIPTDTDFASVLVSDTPIVVQHTRLDTRQAENALLSTVAYAD